MEQYGELRDLTRRYYEAVARGDAALLKRLVSRREGAQFIGTDPDEWWEGSESFLRALRAQAEALGGNVQIVPGQLQAYREGTLGWVVDRGATFRLPGGTDIPCRHTLVFHQEYGEWKLVHQHASIGVRNEEVLGRTSPRKGPPEP